MSKNTNNLILLFGSILAFGPLDDRYKTFAVKLYVFIYLFI